MQCLQRWNKVLAPGLVKGQWTAKEDQLLLSVMNEGAHKNWGSLSARIPGRTSKQVLCRGRGGGVLVASTGLPTPPSREFFIFASGDK